MLCGWMARRIASSRSKVNDLGIPRLAVTEKMDLFRDLVGVVSSEVVFLFVGVCLSLRIFLLVALEEELKRENSRMSCLGAV